MERRFRFLRGLASSILAVLMLLVVISTIMYIIGVQMSDLAEG